MILIETYWNVKDMHRQQKQQEIKHINRDILECKVQHKNHNLLSYLNINRDILECKGGASN